MAFRRRMAAVNRGVANRVLGPVAARLPGFGVIEHTGRRSGRRYRTPVAVFAVPDGYVLAIIYGTESDWVRNVLAAGGCELRIRGRVERLTAPQRFYDERRRQVPPLIRPLLGLAGVTDFIRLTTVPREPPAGPARQG